MRQVPTCDSTRWSRRVAVIAALGLTACGEADAVGIGDGPFQSIDLAAAFARAGSAGGIVVVDFSATWCGPCARLDRETWADDGVQEWLRDHAVALKYDVDAAPDVARRFGVESVPTILLLRPDGSELDRLVGYRGARQFLDEAESALAGKDSVTRVREALDANARSNPMLRMRLADDLAARGDYAEALEHYLWCFDRGQRVQPAFVGVRVSFLLGAIARLGEQYPPALEALRRRRDAAREATREDDSFAAMDFVALNRELGEVEETVRLYRELLQDDGATHARALPRLYGGAFERLVRDHDHEAIVAGAEHFEVVLRERMGTYGMTGLMDLFGVGGALPVEPLKRECREMIAAFYESCLVVGNAEFAGKSVDWMIRLGGSGTMFAALIEAAVRAERPDEARAVAERGLRLVDEDGQRTIRYAMRRIR